METYGEVGWVVPEAAGYAPLPCISHKCLQSSCSETVFFFKVMALVLVVFVVYGGSCHTITVGLLIACSVGVEGKVWNRWIKPIQTVIFALRTRIGLERGH